MRPMSRFGASESTTVERSAVSTSAERGDELAGKRGLELPDLNAERLVGPPDVGVLQRDARSSRPDATGTELALNPPAHVAEDRAGCGQSGAVDGGGEPHVVLIHLSPLDVAAQLD